MSRYRSFRTRHTSGPVLIHAGSKLDPAAGDIYDICIASGVPMPDAVDTGGIVGIVEIVDCVTESESDWFDPGARVPTLRARQIRGSLLTHWPAVTRSGPHADAACGE